MKPLQYFLIVALLGPSMVAGGQAPKQLNTGHTLVDSLRISYYYSYVHDGPLETWLRFGETLTIHDGGGCDIARCEAADDGRLRAFNLDCGSTGPGTFGPWVSSGCSTAEEFGYTVQCCILHLRLSMTGSHTLVDTPGTVITYTYSVRNIGATTLTNVMVADDRLGTVGLSDLAGDGTGTLTPGHTESGSLQYAVTLDDLQSGIPITNTATAYSDQSDPITEEWSVDTVLPTLSFTMRGSHRVVGTAGTTVTYTYEVTNTSAFSLTDVAVEDDLLGPVTLSDNAADGAGVLAPGDSESGTLEYVVTQADIDAGTNILNEATATSAETDPAIDKWIVTVWASGGRGRLVQVARLQSGDAMASDRFGRAVSILGDRALVGSPSLVGAAYIFERDASGMWAQVAKLWSSSPGTYFGESVELSDDRAIVGGTNKAYVFERDTDGTWTEVGILDAGGRGGSLSGDTAVLGAAFEDDFRGAIYVYERDSGGTWTMAARLQASRVHRSVFGSSVAIDGDRMIVGALGEDDYRGAAYVFERGGTGTWNEVARLRPSDLGTYDTFGARVAVRGDRALILAVAPHRGYVYERDAVGAWKQVAVLPPSDESGGFDAELALGDDRALIGAAFSDSRVRTVYVFDRDDGGKWTEIGMLLPDHVEEGNRFGLSVAISGDRAIVGASSEHGTPQSRGEAYIFESVPVGTDVPEETPSEFALSQNYPNPFNPTTTISYDLPRAADATLTVYDVLGRQVRSLAAGTRPAGTYEISFDAGGLPSGVYFYRLEAGDDVETKRMVVVK